MFNLITNLLVSEIIYDAKAFETAMKDIIFDNSEVNVLMDDEQFLFN